MTKKTRKTATKKVASKKTGMAAASASSISSNAAVVSHVVETTDEVQSDLYVKAEALLDAQDKVLLQILTIAELAKTAINLDSELDESGTAIHAANAIDVIVSLADRGIRNIDAKLIQITDERLRAAA